MIVRASSPAGAGPARRRGLSLLEVLAALAIFLLSLAAIAQLVDIGTDRAMDAVYQIAGTRLAQSKLAEVEAGVVPVSTGGAGTFDDEPDWQWSVESPGATVPNVYPVTVKVWRDVRGQRFEVALSQMVCDPLQMGTSVQAQSPTATTTTGETTSGTSGTSGTTGTTTTGGSGS